MEAGKEIRGLKVFQSLSAIGKLIDLVQVFRTSEAALVSLRRRSRSAPRSSGCKMGVRNDEAAHLAEDAVLKVVMSRRPKIELFRPFWKPRLNQQIWSDCRVARIWLAGC